MNLFHSALSGEIPQLYLFQTSGFLFKRSCHSCVHYPELHNDSPRTVDCDRPHLLLCGKPLRGRVYVRPRVSEILRPKHKTILTAEKSVRFHPHERRKQTLPRGWEGRFHPSKISLSTLEVVQNHYTYQAFKQNAGCTQAVFGNCRESGRYCSDLVYLLNRMIFGARAKLSFASGKIAVALYPQFPCMHCIYRDEKPNGHGLSILQDHL